MKKTSKLFAVALLTVIAVCFSVLGSIFASANTSTNLLSWGDAESGTFGKLTAVTTEKYEGTSSFEITPTSATKAIRQRVTSPAVDGTFYVMSLKVKAAAADTSFQIKAIGTSSLPETVEADGTSKKNYAYTTADGGKATISTEWTDYSFNFGYRYVAEESALYFTTDGKTEQKVENVTKAVIGFDIDFYASGTVYLDNIAINPVVEEEEVPTDLIFSTGFEDGVGGFLVDGTSFGKGALVNKTDDANGVRTGEYGFTVSANGYSRNKTIDQTLYQNGYFYNIKTYVKPVDSTSTNTRVKIQIQGQVVTSDKSEYAKLLAMPQTTIKGTEWKAVDYNFGLYVVDGVAYAYHNNKTLEELATDVTAINKLVIMDLITTNGAVYFDDITITKTTVEKDATITVVDANGTAVTGATLVVKDADGNALEVQPEITEEAGVYTVKGLSYSNFAQKYTVSVGENSCTVDFINAEGEITVPVIEGGDDEEEEEDFGDALYGTGFEDDAHGFGVGGTGYNSGVIVNKTEDANVYKGSHALKLSGYSRNTAIIADKNWITNGDFFVYKAYVKLGEGENTRAGAQLILWSADANGSNWAQDARLMAMPYTTITGSEWVELNYVFSVYGNGQTIYVYHNGGVIEEIDAANNYIAPQVYFDLIAQNGTLYYDSLSITKTSVKKDAVLSIFDRAGNPVTGQTLVVKDAEGNALEVQPEITENDGVYTVKGLEYSNFAQNYTISFAGGNIVVDFANSETEFYLDTVEDEVLGEPIFSTGFEDGLNGFAAEEGGSGSCVLDDENAYTGEKSLKVNGIWTRKEFNDGWIQGGNFFKFSAWVKIASGDPQACAQMYIWGAKDENNWVMCSTRICALTYTTISSEWTYVSGIFGVYSDGTTAYAYHNNGILEELDDLAGYNIAYKVVFDLGATVGGSIYYDDISIVPVKAYKNATVTVYGAENPELVVCDENGVALEKQPRIIEENGVYTVRSLGFATFAQKYIVKVYDNGEEYGSQEVSFINDNVIVASPFNGTVTVKDAEGNPVTNATITYGDVTVTENENGVYTLVGLLTTTEVTVICDGLLPGYAEITPENTEAEVVVKAERPVLDIDGNKVFDGNFEDGFNHHLMKQKADAVITNKDQYSGKKGWMLTGKDVSARVLARVSGIDADGVVYYFEAMAKSTNNAIFSIGAICTGYDATGNYCYPIVASDIVALTEEWQKVSMTFSFRHDAVTNKMYMTINGEEVEFNNSFASMAALDLVFTVSNGGIAYVDDIVLFETYTGSVTVKGEDGNLLEDATFVVTDYAGNTLDIEPEYNIETKEYVFANLAGSVKVVATAGGKTYSAVTLSKSLNSVQIESSYTITLTLKDQYGQAVIGAIVYARKLLTTVGHFVDNGDGTYTLEEAMGTVTIVVVADGYSFSRQDGVTADNATLTMIGENFSEPDTSDPTDSSNTASSSTAAIGCGGSMAAMAIVAIPVLLAAVAVLKKKED